MFGAAAACGDPSPEASPAQTPTAAPREPVEGEGDAQALSLIGWPFRPDLLRERLSEFERIRPGVRVRHDQALRNYPARAAGALSGDPPVDVAQVRAGLTGSWLADGALRPLGAEREWSATVDAMWPHARAATVRDGSVIGLPFYSGVMVLAYNRRLLDRVGAPVPSTLEELTAVSLAAVDQRAVEFPISLNLAPKAFANLPWWGLVYAAGGSMRRPDGPDPAAIATLEWLRNAIAVDRIVDPAFMETTYEALVLQKHLFAIVGAYALKHLNTAAPGTFGAAPIPGVDTPAGTVAWTPAYATNVRSLRPELAVDLVRFLGGRDDSGDFASASFWLRSEGLLPAYPEVLRRQDERGGMAAWIDPDLLDQILASARPLEGAWDPWFLTWEHQMQALVHQAVFGQREAEDALRAAHQAAVDLSAAR